jgi:hypothetical protein
MIDIKETDVLVDFGCGKGRVINYWLSLGLRNRLIGVEIDKQLADRTRRRLRRYPNVAIIAGDILENMPADGTVYFTYNSAAAPVMERFRDALFEMSKAHDDLTFVYYVSWHLSVFQEDDEWDIRMLHMPSGIDAAIIRPRRIGVGA